MQSIHRCRVRQQTAGVWDQLPLTKAVLVPAVGVASGDRDGDRVEFPRACSVCRSREDRRGDWEGALQNGQSSLLALQKRPELEQYR